MSAEISSLITRTSEIRHGRPCIAGTGITVHRVALLYKLGHSPEEIVREYEHLSIAGVYAALAYYHANQAEIEAELAADEAEADRIEAENLKQQSPRGRLTRVRLYLDEDAMRRSLVQALRLRGVDVVQAREWFASSRRRSAVSYFQPFLVTLA